MVRKVSAILLIAGSSTRYKKDYNKNFELVNDKPIFSYSLNVFDKITNIGEIILVIKKNEERVVKDFLNNTCVSKEIRIVYGGNSRKESVYNALKEAKYEIVIIHDGARPLIKEKYINECLKNIDEYSGVIVGVPSKDTVKIVDNNNEVEYSTNRDNTWIIQTPQCFRKDVLLRLHEKYKEDFTDDAVLLEEENIPVKIVMGDYTNIKLTTKEDLLFIEQLL